MGGERGEEKWEWEGVFSNSLVSTPFAEPHLDTVTLVPQRLSLASFARVLVVLSRLPSLPLCFPSSPWQTPSHSFHLTRSAPVRRGSAPACSLILDPSVTTVLSLVMDYIWDIFGMGATPFTFLASNGIAVCSEGRVITVPRIFFCVFRSLFVLSPTDAAPRLVE